MRTLLGLFCLCFSLCLFAGCEDSAQDFRPLAGRDKKVLLSVDFQPDKTLRHQFVSSRQIEVDFGQSKGKGKNVIQTVTETMELTFAYEPLEIDPRGFATVRAVCESAKVKRTSSSSGIRQRSDAVETLKGKSFILQVSPSGLLTDTKELQKVIRELGQKAFDADKRKIKNPDMIFDFIATQWFLWDSISSINRPAQGVAVGQSWNSRLLVPLPIPLRAERLVTYTLDEIRQTPAGRVAVIKSEYSPADSATGNWPMPYGGTFQMRGMFGFFGGYEILGLTGEGTELFNIDAGVIEESTQHYKVDMKTVIPFGLGQSEEEKPKPNLKITQEITMRLVNRNVLTPDPS